MKLSKEPPKPNKHASELLDAVLEYFNSFELNDLTYQALTRLREKMPWEHPKDLYLASEYLHAQDYLAKSFVKHDGTADPNRPVYGITLLGRFFLERGGFTAEIRKERRRTTFNAIKIIAIVVNSILILYLLNKQARQSYQITPVVQPTPIQNTIVIDSTFLKAFLSDSTSQ